MRRFVRFINTATMLTLGFVAVPPLAGAESTRAAETEEQSAADTAHGGGKLIDEALDEVQLRPDQKPEVEKMRAEAEKRHAQVRAAKNELLTALADQIEKGKLDRCALAPAIKALASAKAEAHPGDRAAFEQLHSILDPEQRATFVDALRRHWESHKKTHEPAALAEKMEKELSLSADQKESLEDIFTGLHEIREAQPGYAAHRERWTKILDAFKGDRFVLDEVAPMGDVAAHTTAKVEHRLWAGEAILPVFKPEQRKVIADKMREHAKGEATLARQHVGLGMDPSEEE
jgi:Spy/CpxP family protein refolding chaperone